MGNNTANIRVNITLRRINETIVAVESNKYYIFVCVCVCVCVRARVRTLARDRVCVGVVRGRVLASM